MTTKFAILLIILFWANTFFLTFLASKIFGESKVHFHVSFFINFIAFLCVFYFSKSDLTQNDLYENSIPQEQTEASYDKIDTTQTDSIDYMPRREYYESL
ncbi:MAG: hypothetical protein CW341_00810 [Bacteroidetes bacterium]|nr:hypothetical protein [Bacteroidota bacterium]